MGGAQRRVDVIDASVMMSSISPMALKDCV